LRSSIFSGVHHPFWGLVSFSGVHSFFSGHRCLLWDPAPFSGI
jgi:hypothetical protein